MATSTHALGGRLALLKPDDLDSDQKKLYKELSATMVPWAKKSGFQAITDDEELIGPFNAMLRSPVISQAVMGVTASEGAHSSLSEKVRQLVILTVGAAWKADYELYAHAAVGRKAGLDEDAIAALVAGEKPATLSEEESLAYDFTYYLTVEHHINPDLYRRALETFEERGIVDMIYLAGQYMIVSGLLNTFSVPAPAE